MLALKPTPSDMVPEFVLPYPKSIVIVLSAQPGWILTGIFNFLFADEISIKSFVLTLSAAAVFKDIEA